MNVVFGSVEQMISPAGLSGLMGAAIESVQRRPMEVVHFSENVLEQVSGLVAGRPVTFVLKRFIPDKDWVMRLTKDTQVREVALYRMGIYADLPTSVWQPTLAVAPQGNSWAALMEDVSEWLSPPLMVPEPTLSLHLQHLAQIHARFMNDTAVLAPENGLSALEDFVTILAPQTIQRELTAGQSAPVFGMAVEGWQVFARHATPAVAALVDSVQNNVQPLLKLLQESPSTLLHGDYKLANLGLRPGLPEPRTIALDWQDASYGPPLLDLAYWLAVNPAAFPGSQKDRALQQYRTALTDAGVHYTDEEWAKAVALGLLTGGGLRLFWQMALRLEKSPNESALAAAQADFAWWNEKVALARQWLC